MLKPNQRPIFTTTYDNETSIFRPEPGSLYFFAKSDEERSGYANEIRALYENVEFIEVSEHPENAVTVLWEGEEKVLKLKSTDQLTEFWQSCKSRTVYFDISGFSNHVWMPILRAAITNKLQLSAIYVEPLNYTFSVAPTEGELFNLSSGVTGIRPIPGFSKLTIDGENAAFIPLLGFEGARVAHIIEEVQPLFRKIFPIVGVPGFQPHFPFYSFLGNKHHISRYRSHGRVFYARANCPFSLYYVLTDLTMTTGFPLKIAPLGTKPHALGSLLFYLQNPGQVEFVYDNPIRSSNRSTGKVKVLEYDLRDWL